MASIRSDADSSDNTRRHYERLLASVDGIVWEADAQTLQYTFVSQHAERLLGYPLEQWLTPGFWADHLHPEDRSRVIDERLGVSRRLQSYGAEYRMTAADGRGVWLRDRVRVIVEGGEAPRLCGIMTDITDRVTRSIAERRRAEQDRLSYIWFLECLDKVNRAMRGTNDLEQMMRDVLDALLTIFECDRAWLGYPCDPETSWWRVPMERTRPEYPSPLPIGVDMQTSPYGTWMFRTLREAGGPVTFGPGSERPLPEGPSPVFDVRSFMAMTLYPKLGMPWLFGLHQCSYPRIWKPAEERLFQEIGRRLADTLTSFIAYRDLQESELRYREIFENTSDMLIVAGVTGDRRFQLLDVNPAWERLMGVSRDAIAGSLLDRDNTDVIARGILARFRECLEQGAPIDFEQELVTSTGRWQMHTTLVPVSNAAGHIYRLVGVSRNITAQKRAESALAESYSLLNAVFEGTSDAVFVKDLQGRYLMINSAGARFLGREVEEVIGKDDRELFPAEAAQLIMENDRQVMLAGSLQMFEETLESAGVTRTYLATKGVYRDAHGGVIGLIGISRDVTDLKRLEAQLRQAQKMEAVGQLAGGLAHDFNNLLTIINGNSELALMGLPENDPSRELLVEILRSGDRAAGLTRQLLAFSRKQLLQPEVVDLNSLLDELIRLMRRLLGADIELALVPNANPCLTKVDPGQFEQAIINLAINARDAMPMGGLLTIDTRTIILDKEYAAYHPEVRPGQYVLVAVSDTGQGMDEATRARIFEPFFTTKEPGKGTGLGLAMVYGFVRQSGGHVEVYSEAGGGTVFKIYLPCTAESIAAARSPAELAGAAVGGETVLVVEDEGALRSQIRLILQSSGYTVLEARDGREALEVVGQHAGAIDLLLTDVVMPRMNGRQLANQLTEARPGVSVVFMSGYTDEAVMRHGVLDAGAVFLQKPFSPMGLLRKIRDALDAPSGRGS